MIKGKVYKIHSDFCYVASDGIEYECKLLQKLKKRKIEVVVGDYVELDGVDFNAKQAFICNILPRKNYISHPKVANLDKVIIVNAIKEPDLDFEQLDRYLAFAQYFNLDTAICFNKNDLSFDDSFIEKIYSMYEPLGYEIIFTSALEKSGLDDFEELIADKTCVLCGNSGVGKTSIINSLDGTLKLKTKDVSEKTQRGTHTTRHCELIKLSLNCGKSAYIVDTPGFSNLKFDFLMPEKISELFREFNSIDVNCKFKNCLHLNEIGCAVLDKIDEINISRYESYVKFVNEAIEYKNKMAVLSKKEEKMHKYTQNKIMTKISAKKRVTSRKLSRQIIEKIMQQEENNINAEY